MVRLCDGGAGGSGGVGARFVRVPIAPGSFTTVPVAEVRTVEFGESIEVFGPGVLAFDGERDRRLSADQRAIVTVDACGPRLIDVAAVLAAAARDRLFDVPPDPVESQRPKIPTIPKMESLIEMENPDGD